MSVRAFVPRLGAAVGLLAGLGCGGDLPEREEELLLLRVVRVRQGAPGPYDARLCQVTMDVDVIMPDCGIWGRTDNRREGNTFYFQIHAAYSATACFGRGAYPESTSICLPGLRADPPPPPLPSGTYFLVVNGVTGSFTIE